MLRHPGHSPLPSLPMNLTRRRPLAPSRLFLLVLTALALGSCARVITSPADTVEPASLLESGDLVVTTSRLDLGQASHLFDGDTTTLARSADINPMVIDIDFRRKARFRTIRVYAGQSGYAYLDQDEWSLEAADTPEDMESKSGSYFRMPQRVQVQGSWSSATLGEPLERRLVRIRVERTLSPPGHGDYVHVWEIEMK